MEGSSNMLLRLRKFELQTVIHLILHLEFTAGCTQASLLTPVNCAFHNVLPTTQIVEIVGILTEGALSKAKVAVDICLEAANHEVLVVIYHVVLTIIQVEAALAFQFEKLIQTKTLVSLCCAFLIHHFFLIHHYFLIHHFLFALL